MLKILRDRFVGLGRDEDGAALVITLAVFMFIYVLFIGIYAVGTNVRTRIHLQNACDAAAYSAAVVQADTLSRIATINRAMSWTYAQMTRRQMDYIVWKWLEHTCKHYSDDKSSASAFANTSGACSAHDRYLQQGAGWAITDIVLNGNVDRKLSCDDISSVCLDGFSSHLKAEKSFYGLSKEPQLEDLAGQISIDKATIYNMNSCIRELATGMADNIEIAVSGVLKANLKDDLDERVVFYVEQCENPLLEVSSEGYLDVLANTNEDELRFLSFSFYESIYNGDNTIDDADIFWGTGAGTWFVRGKEREKDGERGLRRSYCHYCGDVHRDGKLYSEWSWYATKWKCGDIGDVEYHVPYDWKVECEHSHNHCRCSKGGGFMGNYTNERLEVVKNALLNQWMDAKCYADNDKIYDTKYYVGEVADPLVLTDDYFGAAGTITVGLVAENTNPWSWIGDVSHGVFSAFEPFCKKTFCVASAKAGYRSYVEGTSFGRDYRIDWNDDEERGWNLYTSDWDAVMVPVPRATSFATHGAWSGGEKDVLGDIAGKLGVTAGDFVAGANGAQWQIENPGEAIGGWKELLRRMWH